MRTIHLIIAIIAVFALTIQSCIDNSEKDKGRISNKEAKAWRKALDQNEDFRIYEKFNRTPISYKEIKLQNDRHVKFYLGCDDLSNPQEYSLFYIYIDSLQGDNYYNLFDNVWRYNGKKWAKSDLNELKAWSYCWTKLLDSKKLPIVKAFVVPDNDLISLGKISDLIYISMGLENLEAKMIFSNIKHNDNGNGLSEEGNPDEENFDTCAPCPKVCGENDFPIIL